MDAALSVCQEPCWISGRSDPMLIQSISHKYRRASANGHEVVPLLHDVFGAVHIAGRRLLRRAADCTNGRPSTIDDANAPWSAPTLHPYMSQAVSVALHKRVAEQILQRVAHEQGYMPL